MEQQEEEEKEQEEDEKEREEEEEEQEDKREDEEEEALQPTRRQSRDTLNLPDPKRLWEFLTEKEGWRYTGKGHEIAGPDDSSDRMEQAQVRRVWSPTCLGMCCVTCGVAWCFDHQCCSLNGADAIMALRCCRESHRCLVSVFFGWLAVPVWCL